MKFVDKINGMLEMPQEIYTDQPKIVIIGFNELMIENYKGILQYDEVFIRINTHIGSISISGTDLKLDKMTEDSLKIIGKIVSIEKE